jgi:hypothetical protein
MSFCTLRDGYSKVTFSFFALCRGIGVNELSIVRSRLCMQDRMRVNGNGLFSNTCAAYGGSPILTVAITE